MTEALPGPPWEVKLGTASDVVMASGAVVATSGSEADGKAGSWSHLIGVDGTVLAVDGPRLEGFAATGDWFATQAVVPAPPETQDFDRGITEPWASSEAELVVYRSDGREARRMPGLRVFQTWAESDGDSFHFSDDGRALAVYRTERHELDLYGLDGVMDDETLELKRITPGYAPGFACIRLLDTDRIVMWQDENFGRDSDEWLRVFRRGPSGGFHATSIVHRDRYADLFWISKDGTMLLDVPRPDGVYGYDLITLSGELLWRQDRATRWGIPEALEPADRWHWQPRLLRGGAVLLQEFRGGGRPAASQVIVRYGLGDADDRGAAEAPVKKIVIDKDTKPLGRVLSVAPLPLDAEVDGSGRYMMLNPAEGPQPLEPWRPGREVER